MDEEDIADAEEAKKLQTTEFFAGLGSAADEGKQTGSFMDILKTGGETMGTKLLKKMGWREGQGVGPKIRRKARLEEDNDQADGSSQQFHLFAPENSQMISFVRKNDRRGLGLENEGSLAEAPTSRGTSTPDAIDEDQDEGSGYGRTFNGKVSKKKKPQVKGGFGVGILNDTGSDEEDPYQMGPKISYSRIIGDENKKKRKLAASRSAANPLLNTKPVFVSKKAAAAKGATVRRCQDGRLPLEGFMLSQGTDSLSSILSQEGRYSHPKIPEDWKSSKAPTTTTSTQTSHQSSADIAKASKLSPRSRAALLGETQLPGKSVFDFLTPTARTRIASATNNPNLPPALSEAEFYSSTSQHKTSQSRIPTLPRETALTALGRGTAGWMPYAEDPAKRARYRLFLEIRASIRPEDTLPDRAPGASDDDWINEMNEFAHAAQIFKPMTGTMASRFTSSTGKVASTDANIQASADSADDKSLLRKPVGKAKTPAEEAAAVGMYGPLTRSVENFHPTRLLCKRFNVKPPTHVEVGPGEVPPDEGSRGLPAIPQTQSTAGSRKRLGLVGREDMDKLWTSGNEMIGIEGKRGDRQEEPGDVSVRPESGREEAVVVDPERNEALERERPGDEIFKAIFGSDSEGDD